MNKQDSKHAQKLLQGYFFFACFFLIKILDYRNTQKNGPPSVTQSVNNQRSSQESGKPKKSFHCELKNSFRF